MRSQWSIQLYEQGTVSAGSVRSTSTAATDACPILHGDGAAAGLDALVGKLQGKVCWNPGRLLLEDTMTVHMFAEELQNQIPVPLPHPTRILTADR